MKSMAILFVAVSSGIAVAANVNSTFETGFDRADANFVLAQLMKAVPEIADGVDKTEAMALQEIALLFKDKSDGRGQLLHLLLDCQQHGLKDFKYPLPKYNCAARVLLWLALDGKLDCNGNLSLAVAITDGLFLMIGDDRVKESVRKDSVDALTFFVETGGVQQKLSHKPLQAYPPEALLLLAWRGGSLSSHSFDQRLQPGRFIDEIRKRPITREEYRMHVLTGNTLRAMQRALLGEQPSGNQQHNIIAGYNFYSTKNWDFVEDDKPQLVQIGDTKVPVPLTRSAALIFDRRMTSGKGIGNCSDQDDARQAIWKSIGVPSMNVKMIQIRKGAEEKFWGHIISVYYDADSGNWRSVYTSQKGYPYVWAMSVLPVRYGEYLTRQSGFPKVGSRDYDYQIVSGEGTQGGNNTALTEGIAGTIMQKAIVMGNTGELGKALTR